MDMTNYEKLKEALNDGDIHDAQHYAAAMEEELAEARNHEYAGELKAAREDNARLRGLLKEVTTWHSTQDSGYYNGCDTDPCHWCELANNVLSNAQADL